MYKSPSYIILAISIFILLISKISICFCTNIPDVPIPADGFGGSWDDEPEKWEKKTVRIL